MIFKRRKKANWKEMLRIATWPRRSWSRSVEYARKRTTRISATPHKISLSFCVGIFISFTPLLGIHIAIAALLAKALRGSMIAGALGTFAGNPFTFPFIWASSLGLGEWILGRRSELAHDAAASDKVTGLLDQVWPSIDAQGPIDLIISFGGNLLGLLPRIWDPLILPMLVGGTPIGLLAGFVAYFPIRRMVAGYQLRRENMLKKPNGKVRGRAAPAE